MYNLGGMEVFGQSQHNMESHFFELKSLIQEGFDIFSTNNAYVEDYKNIACISLRHFIYFIEDLKFNFNPREWISQINLFGIDDEVIVELVKRGVPPSLKTLFHADTNGTMAILEWNKAHPEEKVDINGRIKGKTALFYASVGKSKVLLEAGVDISITCDEGLTALEVLAPQYRNFDKIKMLLEAGCNVSKIQYIIFREYVPQVLIDLIFSYGISPSILDQDGYSLLHQNDISVIKRGLGLVDPNIICHGMTPFEKAIKHSFDIIKTYEKCKILIDYGSVVNSNYYSMVIHNPSIFGLLVEKGIHIPHRKVKEINFKAIMLYYGVDRDDVVDFILAAEPLAHNLFDNYILKTCSAITLDKIAHRYDIDCYELFDDIDKAQIMINHGYIPNNNNIKNAYSWHGTPQLLEMLIKAGGPLPNEPILHRVSEDVLKVFLQNGMNIDTTDEFGTSSLMMAVKTDIDPSRLLKYGANPNLQNNSGLTALHYVKGQYRFVDVFLKYGADPYIVAYNGKKIRDSIKRRAATLKDVSI